MFMVISVLEGVSASRCQVNIDIEVSMIITQKCNRDTGQIPKVLLEEDLGY